MTLLVSNYFCETFSIFTKSTMSDPSHHSSVHGSYRNHDDDIRGKLINTKK